MAKFCVRFNVAPQRLFKDALKANTSNVTGSNENIVNVQQYKHLFMQF